MQDQSRLSEIIIPGVHPKAQPYYYRGNHIGCLLVHGFTGSPPELRPLGEYLANQGYTVWAPLLAGHGTSVEDLARTKWTDWLNSAAQGLLRLRGESVDRIYLIGLSMGGLLCLLLAAAEEEAKQGQASGSVAGVVTLNSPIALRIQKEQIYPFLQRFLSSSPQDYDRVSPEAANALRFSYPKMPLRGITNLLRLIREVKTKAAQVKVPALVVQSLADETVRPDSGEFIYQNLGSWDKKLLWLERAPHLLTLGSEKETVFQAVQELIQRGN